MPKKDLLLVNREISWLSFNHRVLQEAADTEVPIVERLKFLGIFSNNLDEFFRVRVATLRRLINVGKGVKKILGENPRKVLEKIQRIVIAYQNQFDQIYSQIRKELEVEGISILNETQLSESQKQYLRKYYNDNIALYTAPIMLSRIKIFPQLTDQSIYLAVKLYNSDNPENKEFAIVEIPTRYFPRFIELPVSAKGKQAIILLDDVIRFCLDDIFALFDYDAFEAYTIKITRDAELDVDNDISESLIEKIAKGVQNRKKAEAVRFVYDSTIPADLLSFIVNGLELDEKDYVYPGSRYHNFKDFMSFPCFNRKVLVNEPLSPVPVPFLDNSRTLMEVMAQRDFILHYPYHSFHYYLRLLREAALDPNVRSIFITLYRVGTESRVIHALINAAQNGKKVTALIELRARFDEQANIHWSRQMQDAGVNVIFGIPGLKVHSKMTLITRKEGKRLVKYATISTGNFHEGNANLYTDVNLFTVNSKITNEVQNLFTFLEQNYKSFTFKHLLVSPVNMRKKLYALIDNEIRNARAGKKAYLLCKINNLVDEGVISKLYQASQAGVKIKLIVRSICSLVPGIPGISENIEIYSIVDRFLEHSRIFIFGNNGNELCYISSADWMTRNLDHRVEVAVPILDKKLVEELKMVVEFALTDNVKSRIINQTQNNVFKSREGKTPFRSQLELYSYYRQKAE